MKSYKGKHKEICGRKTIGTEKLASCRIFRKVFSMRHWLLFYLKENNYENRAIIPIKTE